MSETKIIKMRTDKFRIAYEAMKEIAGKTLPEASEVKLALLVKAYEKTYDATSTVFKKVEAKFGRRVGRMTVLSPEGIVRRDRIAETLISVKLPLSLIVREDLPKKSEEEDDTKNRAATALFMALLGPFYDHKATGTDKELLATDLDADSLAALEAAADDEVSAEAVALVPALPNAVEVPAADRAD